MPRQFVRAEIDKATKSEKYLKIFATFVKQTEGILKFSVQKCTFFAVFLANLLFWLANYLFNYTWRLNYCKTWSFEEFFRVSKVFVKKWCS